ncbi:MAG: hypothetical protein LQ345_003586 [Seirophora villosa]|nr:MAG: hypothetical protein LQ345_003586 [Seirophora villosa]
MLDFTDYVQYAFYESSHWNRNNSYALLDFPTPLGLRLHISALSTPQFASSYSLASTGLLCGSLSYLYTSLALPALPSATRSLPLPAFTPTSYRQLLPLRPPDPPWWWEIWHTGRRIDNRDALLYGRLYLPQSTLEALYLRRLSPTTQLKINAVSDVRLPNGGSVLALLAQDTGRWSAEYMYSTDSALLGVRGLYNFGPDPRNPGIGTKSPATETVVEEVNVRSGARESVSGGEQVSRFSAGAEVYYGLLNKSGGMSTGVRFATLPAHTGFPYTMTLTLNPLMGNLSSSYSVRAGDLLSLSSRFDFNVYSYESGVVVGTELWKLRDLGEKDGRLSREEEKQLERTKETIEAARRGGLVEEDRATRGGDIAGCLKARVNQRGMVGLLWEGRVKELVYSCGASIDMRGGKDIINGVGLELQYSS